MIYHKYIYNGVKYNSFSEALSAKGNFEFNFECFKTHLGIRYSLPPETLCQGITRESGISEQYEHITDFLSYLSKNRPHYRTNYAVLISGGVDSSILAKIYDSSNTEFYTLETPRYSERKYVEALASTLKGKVNYCYISDEEYSKCLHELYSIIDYPIGDTAMVGVYYLSKIIRDNGIGAIVVGDGADEAFGGYWKYPVFYRMGEIDFPTLYRHYSVGFNYFPKKMVNYFISNEKSILSMVMNWDRRFPLLNIYAYKNIYGAKLAGISCISPYVSKNVWDFADRLSPNDLVNAKDTKIWLKKLAYDLGVPEICLDRIKSGFDVKLSNLDELKDEISRMGYGCFDLSRARDIDIYNLWTIAYWLDKKGYRIWS